MRGKGFFRRRIELAGAGVTRDRGVELAGAATSGQKARDGNVLVEIFPVQARAAQLDLFALRNRRMQ